MHEMETSVNKYTIADILKEFWESPEGTVCYVGTDSSTSKRWTSFITVIVLHKGVKGMFGGKGCKVFPYIETEPKIKSLPQKLLKETYVSMGYVLELLEGNDEYPGIPREYIEVHSDYNADPKHKSYAVVEEARRYVAGMQLTHRIKPDALAATGGADFLGRKNRLKIKVQEQNLSSAQMMA